MDFQVGSLGSGEGAFEDYLREGRRKRTAEKLIFLMRSRGCSASEFIRESLDMLGTSSLPNGHPWFGFRTELNPFSNLSSKEI